MLFTVHPFGNNGVVRAPAFDEQRRQEDIARQQAMLAAGIDPYILTYSVMAAGVIGLLFFLRKR
jgi:hypothetical protein